MNQPETRFPTGPEPRRKVLGWWITVAHAMAGAIGLGGLLYGIGFLVVRSHQTALGFWTGIPLGASELAEEGGRFLFYLCYVPVSLLIRFDGRAWGALLILAGGADLAHWISARLSKGVTEWKGSPLLARTGQALAKVRHAGTLVIALSLAGTVLPLELLWQAISARDLLASPELQPQDLMLLRNGLETYSNIVARVVWAIALGCGVAFCFWKTSGLFRHALLVAQWLVIIAAIGALPIAYGKLMLPTAYPMITHPRLTLEERGVLVGRSDDEWVVWTLNTKRTLVLKRLDDEVVTLGPKQSVIP